MLTGISSSINELDIKGLLGNYGEIIEINIIQSGDSQKPMALVAMQVTNEVAFKIVSKFARYWFKGCLITANLLPYR